MFCSGAVFKQSFLSNQNLNLFAQNQFVQIAFPLKFFYTYLPSLFYKMPIIEPLMD